MPPMRTFFGSRLIALIGWQLADSVASCWCRCVISASQGSSLLHDIHRTKTTFLRRVHTLSGLTPAPAVLNRCGGAPYTFKHRAALDRKLGSSYSRARGRWVQCNDVRHARGYVRLCGTHAIAVPTPASRPVPCMQPSRHRPGEFRLEWPCRANLPRKENVCSICSVMVRVTTRPPTESRAHRCYEYELGVQGSGGGTVVCWVRTPGTRGTESQGAGRWGFPVLTAREIQRQTVGGQSMDQAAVGPGR